MPDSISPQTAEKIRRFCQKISVAYDLDDEIQEELYGHIEDRVLGYITGEEQLTEEDAFVLVREHFGNPENVRALLEEAHGRTSRGAFLRRIGAVLVATAAVEILISLRLYVADFMRYIDRLLFTVARDFAGKTTVPFYPLSFFTRWFSLIAIALVLWYILVRWQKGLKSDHTPWFQRLKPSLFVGLFAIMLLLQMIDPMIRGMHHAEDELFEVRRPRPVSHAVKPDVSIFDGSFVFRPTTFHNLNRHFDFRDCFALAYFALQLLAWLWWCDIPQRRMRSLLSTMGVWVGYSSLIPFILPRIAFILNESTRQVNITLLWLTYFRFWHGLLIPITMCFIGLGIFILGVYLALTRFRIMEQRMGLLELREKLA